MCSLAVLLCSCVSTGPMYPLLPSSVPLQLRSYHKLGWLKGESCVSFLFGFIPTSPDYSLKKAYYAALNSDGSISADALISLTTDRKSTFWLFGSTSCKIVEGIGIKFIDRASNQEAISQKTYTPQAASQKTYKNRPEKSCREVYQNYKKKLNKLQMLVNRKETEQIKRMKTELSRFVTVDFAECFQNELGKALIDYTRTILQQTQ